VIPLHIPSYFSEVDFWLNLLKALNTFCTSRPHLAATGLRGENMPIRPGDIDLRVAEASRPAAPLLRLHAAARRPHPILLDVEGATAAALLERGF